MALLPTGKKHVSGIAPAGTIQWPASAGAGTVVANGLTITKVTPTGGFTTVDELKDGNGEVIAMDLKSRKLMLTVEATSTYTASDTSPVHPSILRPRKNQADI